MGELITRRRTLAFLAGGLSTTLAACASFAPDSNLRPVPVGLQNERSVAVQATLEFDDNSAMVVTVDDNRLPTWTITPLAGTEIWEDYETQPRTYEPRIEVKRLRDESVLYADRHDVEVPTPRGSRTRLDITVMSEEVRVDILPMTGT